MAKDEAEKKEKPVEPISAPPVKKKKMLLLGAGVFLIVLIGGASAFFFLKKGPSHTEAATTSEEKGAHKTDATTPQAPKESDKKSTEAGGKKDEGKTDKAHEDEEKKEGKDHEEAKGNKENKAESAAAPTPDENTSPSMGDSYRFETFHLNLGNPLYNHYIRMNLSLEYRNGDLQRNEIEKRKDQLRDIIITVTGKKTREFLLSPDGKDQLRLEITKSINRYLQKPIEAVYITDFLIE